MTDQDRRRDRERLTAAVAELESAAELAEDAAGAADRLWFSTLARRLRTLAAELRSTAVHLAIQLRSSQP